MVTPTFTRPFHPSHSPEPAEIQAADLSGHRNGEAGELVVAPSLCRCDGMIIAIAISYINTHCYCLMRLVIKSLIAKRIYFVICIA